MKNYINLNTVYNLLVFYVNNYKSRDQDQRCVLFLIVHIYKCNISPLHM